MIRSKRTWWFDREKLAHTKLLASEKYYVVFIFLRYHVNKNGLLLLLSTSPSSLPTEEPRLDSFAVDAISLTTGAVPRATCAVAAARWLPAAWPQRAGTPRAGCWRPPESVEHTGYPKNGRKNVRYVSNRITLNKSKQP